MLKWMLIVTASVLASCASATIDYASYKPLQGVPPDFLSAYPQGSQIREPKDLQRTFERASGKFQAIYKAALTRDQGIHGKIEFVLALNPRGTVEAVGLLSSAYNNPTLERALMAQAGLLNFGMAPGEGFFVFHYPVSFSTD